MFAPEFNFVKIHYINKITYILIHHSACRYSYIIITILHHREHYVLDHYRYTSITYLVGQDRPQYKMEHKMITHEYIEGGGEKKLRCGKRGDEKYTILYSIA